MTATEDPVRADWLGLLAQSPPDLLAELADPLLLDEPYTLLRGPETGLYMANARIDGHGNRFNLAEVPVSRCTVRSARGPAGVGYRLGRSPETVVRIARLDALLQVPGRAEEVHARILAPLREHRRAMLERETAATATSRVRFDTLTPEKL
jgi:alpha-D-ribose 1-methylphosphonate 5-triphosphate synthase subunit PhnG